MLKRLDYVTRLSLDILHQTVKPLIEPLIAADSVFLDQFDQPGSHHDKWKATARRMAPKRQMDHLSRHKESR
jgi:hypothetical protein